MNNSEPQPSNFIREIIAHDNKSGKFGGVVITRFPPEPNGYLHVGHAKSICLNFGVAAENKPHRCHLRFDDTNPIKEEVEYVNSIMEDVRWLGFDWGENLFYASDYFEKLYNFALELIKKGKAYVCSLSADEMREYRGTLTEPGKESPFRNRSAAENLNLFQRMRAGEFDEGEHVLRAKIDMTSGNLNMRDPVIFRILKTNHHRTGGIWPIYPMYDYAHCVSDSIERITHSLCTLEFEDHRPLYDWILDELGIHHPQQIEFARLNLSYTILSKRKLIQLVNGNHVNGWDDPRMPTISGIRRRGYTPETIRNFCSLIGVAKAASVVDVALLEHTLREDLNEHSLRVMAVLRPLKVTITNYPEDQVEEFAVPNHPAKPEMGNRNVPFSREIYIEQNDFMENPPKKFFRLAPGSEVRLRAAYFITCNEVIKDEQGKVIELRCSYDPASRGGASPDGRKVKGTIHWVSIPHCLPAEVRLYDRLFTEENPDSAGGEFTDYLNPDSLEMLPESRVEPSLAEALPESRFQFERTGYFCVDRYDSKPGKLVFNRTVMLRDSWSNQSAG